MRSKRNLEVGAAVLGIALAGLGGHVGGKIKDAKLFDGVDDGLKALQSDKTSLLTHAATDGKIAGLTAGVIEGSKDDANRVIDKTSSTPQEQPQRVSDILGDRRIKL